jgi:hypothetical protein
MPHDDGVLSGELARALRDAGLQWTPARGDSFVMPDRGMGSEVFVLSDLTIELHESPTGPVIGFNGTTEWALDSIEQSEALWVPAEHQLPERLGDAFAGLAPTGDGYWVTLRVDGATSGYDGSASGRGLRPGLAPSADVAARPRRPVRHAPPQMEGEPMASNGPDPREFLEQAQRMLRELFGEQQRPGDQRRPDDPWAEATRRRELTPEEQRENLTFALATRAVEALEDLALNVAAIRQRLERQHNEAQEARPPAKKRAKGAAGAED